MDAKPLSLADAAYIAGIIDGEGTVTLIRKHKNENRQLAVSVSNNERYLLEYLLKTIGMGKITNKRVRRQNHAPNFTYALYNRQALWLLEQVSAYLKTYKSLRAKLILENYIRLTPRNGKYTEELKSQRTAFEVAVLKIKPTMVITTNTIETE